MGNLEIIHLTLQRGAADGASRESRALAERVTAAAQRAALSAKSLVQRLLAFGRQQTACADDARRQRAGRRHDRDHRPRAGRDDRRRNGAGRRRRAGLRRPQPARKRAAQSRRQRARRDAAGRAAAHRHRQHRLPRRTSPTDSRPARTSSSTSSIPASASLPSISTACSSPSSRPRTPAAGRDSACRWSTGS